MLRPGATGLSGRPSGDSPQLREQFTRLLGQPIVEGAGHDLPKHRPDAVVDALLTILA